MSSRPRRLAWLAVLAAVGVTGSSCAASRLIAYRLSPDAPAGAGSVAVAGPEGAVRIVLDRHRVPHVQAHSLPDALFAVGWLHGRDRLWQMEMLRRIATGRLAELLGNSEDAGTGLGDTVAVDRWFRVFGMARGGEAALLALSAESRRALDAYVAGINESMRTVPLPLEYRLLDARPEPWTAAQVLAVVRFNAWNLSLNLPQELLRYVVRAALGEDFQQETFPPFDHPGPYVVEPADRAWPARAQVDTAPREPPAPDAAGDPWAAPANALLGALAAIPSAVPSWGQPASNNWVLAGSRTASGRPILANDPHLGHGAPATFYLVHVQAPGLDVVGATLPGTPVVSLGHNRHVAWAATTTFADVQDVYLEKADPADPRRVLVPGGSEAIREVDSPILEKTSGGMKVHPFTLRFTRHGVVLNEAAGDLLPAGSPILALRTTLEEPADDLAVMLDVARARDLGAWRRAMSGWAVPIMNWLAADDAGHIGYFPAGRVPRRRGWDGTHPVPGWDGRHEWDGWIPVEDLPQLWDPPSGRIVTANNKVVPPDRYPWPYTLDAAPGYRAGRIVDLLDARPKWTIDEVRLAQMDTYSKQADRLLPSLIAAARGLDLSPRERQALALLESWDRRADTDRAGATVFFVTWREAWTLALDELPPAAVQVASIFGYVHGFFDRLWADVPAARVWDRRDTPAVEDRDAVLRLAFRKAVAALADALGRDPATWTWGRVHQVTFEHPFGGPGGLAGDFDVGPHPVGGSDDSVLALGGTRYGPDCRFPVRHGPVFRQVVEPGNPSGGGMVLDLGQSGWPRTDGYSHAFADWRDGRLWNVSQEAGEYERESTGTIVLRPR